MNKYKTVSCFAKIKQLQYLRRCDIIIINTQTTGNTPFTNHLHRQQSFMQNIHLHCKHREHRFILLKRKHELCV